MTAMTVVYLTHTGTAVGAFTTATPGPEIDPARLSGLTLPVRTSGKGPKYTPVSFGPSEVATFATDTGFVSPVSIFDWWVVSTTTPDGKVERRLDRLLDADVIKTHVETKDGVSRMTVKVPRTGTALTLKVSIRNDSGALFAGRIDFAPADTEKTLTVDLPGTGEFVVFVEGYQAVRKP